MAKKNTEIKLGKYLRQKREELKITQGEIAKKLGYSSSQFISNWERDVCGPPVHDMKKIKKLIKMLQVEPSDYIERVLIEERRRLEKGLLKK